MQTVEIVGLILGGSSGTAVITILLTKVVGRKKEAVDMEKSEADLKKNEAELQKIIQDVYGGVVTTMKQQIKDLQVEIEKLGKVVNIYRLQEIEWAGKRRSLISKIKNLEKTNNNLSKHVDELSKNNENYESQITECTKEIETLRAQVDILNKYTNEDTQRKNN